MHFDKIVKTYFQGHIAANVAVINKASRDRYLNILWLPPLETVSYTFVLRLYYELHRKKTVFGACNQVKINPTFSVAETS